MDSFNLKRYLGVGVGVGLASFAFYHSINQSETPSHNVSHNVTLTEIREQFQEETNIVPLQPASVDVNPALLPPTAQTPSLAQRSANENQIQLPATDAMTAGKLQLAPALTLAAPNDDDRVFELPLMTEPSLTRYDAPQQKIAKTTDAKIVDAQTAQPASRHAEFFQANEILSNSQESLTELTNADLFEELLNEPAIEAAVIAVTQPRSIPSRANQATNPPTTIATVAANTDGSSDGTVRNLASPNEARGVNRGSWKTNPFLDANTPTPTISNNTVESFNSDFVIEPSESNILEYIGSEQANSQPTASSNQGRAAAQNWINQQPTQSTGQLTNDPYAIAPQQSSVSESVAQRAAQHIEYGKALSRRGATFAARQEFYAAIRILAQSNDASSSAHEHTQALRKGIMALNEAEEFYVSDTENQIAMAVDIVIETHRSGVLTKEEAARISPTEAMQRYFAFAEHQLEMAGGQNVVAAEALFCMGKLHSVSSQHDPTSSGLDVAKAIVFHRAALTSDSNNYRSANELGVLLARTGRLNESKALLKQSLLIKPAPQVWKNLAKVHQRSAQGSVDASKEQQLAQLAQYESSRLAQTQASGDMIQWMPTPAFNAAAPIEFHEAVASKPAAIPTAQPADSSQSEESKDTKPKSFGERLKDLF